MGSIIKKIAALFGLFALGFSSASLASPENDRIYQLESVGCLRANDNVDGIFGDYLEEQFLKYFSHQSRFIQKRLKGLEDVLEGSKVKSAELLKQPEILKKIAQKFKTENLIRSRVYKEGDSYRFVFEWVYAPKGDVLSNVEFRYTDPKKDEGLQGSDLPIAIEKGLDELVQKLPFIGQVTGIDQDTITVSVGKSQNVKPKEIVTISTLQSIKRHPLLNTIEEWRWQPVARAQIQQVEESLSFAKVIETEPGQHLLRFQKVREILPAPPEAEVTKSDGSIKRDVPRIGWVAGNIGLGNYSRDVGISGGNSGRSGGGMMEALELESQVWLNSRFIAEASLMTSLMSYGPSDIVTGTATGGSYSGSAQQFRLAGGYSLFPMKTVFDPMAWVRAGFKSTSYKLPVGAADYTGDSSFGSLFIGVGGTMPLNNEFSGQLGLDLGLLKGASADSLSFGGGSSSTDLSFNFAGVYHYQDQIYFRLLFKVSSQSMDFANGNTLAQKMFSISPSIMYYF